MVEHDRSRAPTSDEELYIQHQADVVARALVAAQVADIIGPGTIGGSKWMVAKSQAFWSAVHDWEGMFPGLEWREWMSQDMREQVDATDPDQQEYE